MTTPRLVTFNILLILGGLLAALGLAEMVTRLLIFHSLVLPKQRHHSELWQAHESRGWSVIPNEAAFMQTLDYAVLTKTNSRGLNDEEHAYEKPAGVYRILLVGDSFMFGREVPRYAALPALLRTAFAPRRAVEVINLSAVGYGTVQEYLYLQEEGFKYSPDLVLLAMFPYNDLVDNSRELNGLLWGEDAFLTWGRPYARWNAAESRLIIETPDSERVTEKFALDCRQRQVADRQWDCRQRAALLILLSQAAAQISEGMKTPVYDPAVVFGAYLTGGRNPQQVPLWDSSREITLRLVEAMQDACRRHGAKFAVLLIPSKLQVDPEYQQFIRRNYPEFVFDMRLNEKILTSSWESQGIQFLELAPHFERAYASSRTPLYFRIRDEHWTTKGHAVAAAAVKDFVLKTFME